MFHNQSSFASRIPSYLFGFGLLIIMGLGYWSYRSQTEHERLFYRYFESIPVSDYGQSRALAPAATLTPARDQAIRFQMEKDHQSAFSAWEAHLEQYGEAEPLDLLYAAANAMAYGHKEQAAWYLGKIKDVEDKSLAQEALWYQALLYLLTNEVAKSAATLAEIDITQAPAKIRRQFSELQSRLANPPE